MKKLAITGKSAVKAVINLYLILFFTFGWTVPVYAQEASNSALMSNIASASASLMIDTVVNEATKSAISLLGEEIPALVLPFTGNYPVSLGYGEHYQDQDLIKRLGELGKQEHNGIDFETPEGTPILAVDDGEVVISGEGDFGQTIKISHAWGDSVYGHLKELKIIKDTKVTKGQLIGLSGSTGITDGPHLHFGIKPKNPVLAYLFGFIDPAPFLPSKIATLHNVQDKLPRNDEGVLGISTPSASLIIPKAENIATDSGYLFNYKFGLENGVTAHFYDKATKRASFAIADQNYNSKLRFFLRQSNNQPTKDPVVIENKLEYQVEVGGIPMTLRYTLDQGKVKEEFIINEKPSEELLSQLGEELKIPFDLSMENLKIEKQGGKYLFKSQDGAVSWTIHEATVEDSEGKTGTAEEVKLDIASEAVLGISTAFLKEASYPVIIDPTWTQSNWDGGSGASTTNQFSSASNVTTSVANQTTLASASSWYNTSWKYRKKITLNNTDAVLGVTATSLSSFPLLVKLTSSNFDFTKAISNGEDIRFIDPDGTVLSYQIESWSAASQVAYVWVKVPSVDTTGTDYIYLYYGHGSVGDGQAATSVWGSNYKGVWHLKENPAGSAPQIKDSTSNANNGTNTGGMVAGQQVSGQVNGSLSFDGTNDYINMANPASLTVTNITISAWVNATALHASQVKGVVNKLNWSGTQHNSYALEVDSGSRAVVRVGNGTISVAPRSTTSLSLNTWYYITGTYDGSNARIYVNGVLETTAAYTGGIGTNTEVVGIGTNYLDANRYWNGKIDEVRISNSAHSTAWIAAEYVGQKTSESFNTYASEECQVACSGTLTSAIFDTGAGFDWTTISYSVTTPSNTSASVKVRTGNQSDLSDATAFSACSAISSGSTLSIGGCATNGHRYAQYEISLSNTDALSTPTFSSFSLSYILTPPSDFSGSAASSSSINWSWTDNSSGESGFYVQDSDGNTKCTVSSANTTTCTETGLSSNTSYIRKVVAYNSVTTSSASSTATVLTFSTAPTISNITANRGTSSWTNNPTFSFTNTSGFGVGGVQYFLYTWDTSSTHTWTGSESSWTSGTLSQTATSDANTWYLHLKGYNSGDVSNGTLDMGPFYYDGTAPTAVTLNSPSDVTYTSVTRPTFKWQAASTEDATAGLAKYQFSLINGGNTYILIDAIPINRTADYETDQYLVHYDGFGDTDTSNNYISLYTKSSIFWTSDQNDGSLKAGKNTWSVVSIDNAGNTTTSSWTIYADFINPTLSGVSLDKVGEKDGYLITSKTKPVIAGLVTDNLAPGSAQFYFYKQNYFLGFKTSQELALSITDTFNNSQNDLSVNFDFTTSQDLEYGKYQLVVTGIDKAGNKSQSQTFNLQILTAEKANQLLTIKDDKDQKVPDESGTISLVDLEKKARLRREKEAAELEKALSALKQGFEQITSYVVIMLGDTGNQFAGSFNNATTFVADKFYIFRNATAGFVTNSLALIKYEGKVLADVTFSWDASLNDSQSQFKQQLYESQESWVTQIATSVGVIDNQLIQIDSMLHTMQAAVTNNVSAQYQIASSDTEIVSNKVVLLLVSKWQDARQNVIQIGEVSITVATQTSLNGLNVVEDRWISAITTVNNSQDNTKKEIVSRQQSIQTELVLAVNGVNSNVKTVLFEIDNIIKGADQNLTSSQVATKLQIDDMNKGISKRLADAGEATQVVYRSIIKPAVSAKNFGDRVVKGTVIAFSTFQAYVFDETPTRIANVTIEELGSDYMIVSWETNHYTNSNKVNFGEDLSYGKEAWGNDGEKQHRVKLEGLKPGKRYFFEVMGQNKNYVYDAYYSFETNTLE